MKSLNIILGIVVIQAAGCLSPPSVSVNTSLRRHDLKGKTLAVGGFTAQNIMDYPGQTAEETIVRDAGTALQKRLKHSRVLTTDAAWLQRARLRSRSAAACLSPWVTISPPTSCAGRAL